jgi:hypothetical protein
MAKNTMTPSHTLRLSNAVGARACAPLQHQRSSLAVADNNDDGNNDDGDGDDYDNTTKAGDYTHVPPSRGDGMRRK